MTKTFKMLIAIAFAGLLAGCVPSGGSGGAGAQIDDVPGGDNDADSGTDDI